MRLPEGEGAMLSQAAIQALDDYQGELTRSLEKLELERVRGTLNPEEQMDFIEDLRHAMGTRDLTPLRRRGKRLALAALACGSAALAQPDLAPPAVPAWQVALGVLALLLLGAAGLCALLVARRRRRDEALLAPLEQNLRQGRTIFD